MAIFRGIGGAGDATNDSIVGAVTEQAVDAALSAAEAASSASSAVTSAASALSSATSASTSATNAAASEAAAATSETNAASSEADADASATAAASSEVNAANSASNAALSETNAALSESNAASSASSASTSATSAASSATAAAASESVVAANAAAASASEIAAAASETAAAASESAAATSATAAATSATSASASATAAAGSASSAATLATAAAASESAAATSETNAAASESSAATSASNASTSASNAATSASNASTSEANALTYKNAAATSATNAANSASAASTSATNAATSESNAATSESNAATSATAASGSAYSAATSASNASTSATAAAGSASNAATSATNAATSETNAASSATAAASSASAASTSASNAASSASAAASSASSASASADAALAALDNFDDRYLGQKTSDPTLDNDGNALVAGALYFNTTDSAMKVYDGSQWLSAYASLSGALLASNNLSDLSDAASARTNLGVAIGSDVQAYNANTVIDASYVHTDNNYTTAEKSKLAGIADGAEVNVQSDWNAVSGDAFILNKPTAVSAFTNDAGYLTSFTESDPIYTASTWYTTTNNSTNWNTAYGWGNHASAGYQDAATAITTSNIGSQSVNYATTAGNAATATKLATARTINGVSFDGSADITIADSTKVAKAGDTMTGSLNLLGNNTTIGVTGGGASEGRHTFKNARGTVASPTQNLIGDRLLYVDAQAYTGSAWTGGGSLQFVATDNITSSARGSSARLYAIPAGSTFQGYLEFNGDTASINDSGGASSTILSSSNYNSYAPTKTGTGASGTWGISITGSSASCTGNAATVTNGLYTTSTIDGGTF